MLIILFCTEVILRVIVLRKFTYRVFFVILVEIGFHKSFSCVNINIFFKSYSYISSYFFCEPSVCIPCNNIFLGLYSNVCSFSTGLIL